MTRMQPNDPAKTPAPSKPAAPRIPDGTVPHNVPPARKPTDADPDPHPKIDRGDGTRTVRRDG